MFYSTDWCAFRPFSISLFLSLSSYLISFILLPFHLWRLSGLIFIFREMFYPVVFLFLYSSPIIFTNSFSSFFFFFSYFDILPSRKRWEVIWEGTRVESSITTSHFDVDSASLSLSLETDDVIQKRGRSGRPRLELIMFLPSRSDGWTDSVKQITPAPALANQLKSYEKDCCSW